MEYILYQTTFSFHQFVCNPGSWTRCQQGDTLWYNHWWREKQVESDGNFVQMAPSCYAMLWMYFTVLPILYLYPYTIQCLMQPHLSIFIFPLLIRNCYGWGCSADDAAAADVGYAAADATVYSSRWCILLSWCCFCWWCCYFCIVKRMMLKWCSR